MSPGCPGPARDQAHPKPHLLQSARGQAQAPLQLWQYRAREPGPPDASQGAPGGATAHPPRADARRHYSTGPGSRLIPIRQPHSPPAQHPPCAAVSLAVALLCARPAPARHSPGDNGQWPPQSWVTQHRGAPVLQVPPAP
ncbi:hypothetical protein NDU88_005434 [Pleurodeles waltl]|uniref:Uncharacterized protein n=1 Tax=Pleurodeles waltl TaxID=8319 RepID=A0AAV7WYS2_PLEWA|nr:hypothetical protein NDU88_005434 [Pleurodeles waltl]